MFFQFRSLTRRSMLFEGRGDLQSSCTMARNIFTVKLAKGRIRHILKISN